MNGRFVAYYRVSTARQGQSGLGLEAQRAAVAGYAGMEIVAEFTEIETAKGSNALDRRPQLRAALDMCKKRKAALVIAKLDRLARNIHFVSGLIESGVEFVAADMPHANKTMIQMHAVMAEWERDQISKRTREALAAAKARGVRLGVAGPRNLRPNLDQRIAAADAYAAKLQKVLAGLKGLPQRIQVTEINALGIPSPAGRKWHLRTLQRVRARLATR